MEVGEEETEAVAAGSKPKYGGKHKMSGAR